MNKKISLIVTIVISVLIMPTVDAQRGCCSHHGGVAGCTSSGRQICKDGTLSPSCTCTPIVKDVYGCMDNKAKNYNENATKDDGTCKYYTYGCTDSSAINYNSKADKDDGTCEYHIYGCMDNEAKNYNERATKDDGTCKYYIYGCTDSNAINYNSSATKLDGSCKYETLSAYEETKMEDNDDDSSWIFGMIATITGIVIYKKVKK